jgi:hypothetical protein
VAALAKSSIGSFCGVAAKQNVILFNLQLVVAVFAQNSTFGLDTSSYI